MAFSLRTIFLAIRGTYQAGNALKMAKTDMDKLQEAQKKVIVQTQEMVRQSYQWMFAGAAFLAFGGMVTKAAMNMMQSTRAGYREIKLFGLQTSQAFKQLAEVITPILSIILRLWTVILQGIVANPVLRLLVGGFIALAGPIMMVGGALLLFKSTLGMITGLLSLTTINTSMLTSATYAYNAAQLQMAAGGTLIIPTIEATNTAMVGLAITATKVLGIFLLVATVVGFLIQKFGLIPALIISLTGVVIALAVALWSGATAMSVLTFGAAALAGVGAAVAASKLAPTYQQGTSFVRQGGWAMLHGGEEIKSARESTYISKVEKSSVQTQGPQTMHHWNVPITIENLHTRAAKEDVYDEIRRALKDELDKKV